MNKSLLWSVLIGSIASFTSCSDEEFIEESGQVTPQEGVEIGIGASAQYEPNGDSRTIYPGIQVDGIEKINWITGQEGYHGKGWVADEITILSPNAVGPVVNGQQQNYAEYKLVKHTEPNPQIGAVPSADLKASDISAEKNDIGTFTPADRTPVGLKWNTELQDQTEHMFYAVYPSNNLNKSVKLTESQGKVTFEGTIASSQAAVGYIKDPSDKSGNTFIAMPVMRQNYMWAVHKATPSDVSENAISLDFRTIGTVLEVELVWPESLNTKEEVRVSSVMLSCNKADVNLCGDFKVDLTNVRPGEYPVAEPVANTDKFQNIITVNLDADPNDDVVGISLPAGSKLKVRFIMLPIKNLKGEELTLTVRGPKGQRSHVIAQSSSKFVVAPHKLNMVKNVTFPARMNESNWISLLDDRILLSQLSIPGTGSSYLSDSSRPATKYAQYHPVYSGDKNITTQWSMGIRCFDITAASAKESGLPGDFGSVPLRIDNKETIKRVTVNDAFQTLLANVKATNKDNEAWNGEFGMMIVRYQPTGERQPQQFVDDFQTYFYDNLPQDRFCLYRPNLTVGEARGKIMVILCPTSEGEDDLDKITARNDKYLLVNGCGSHPDKFYKRGYFYTIGKDKNRVISSVANPKNLKPGENLNQTAEYYIANKQANKLSYDINEARFIYKTNQKTFQACMQDWPRVIDGNGTDLVTLDSYQWRASYQEKLEDAKNTFRNAVLDKSHSNTVYINSICGFLVNNANSALGIGQYQPVYNGNWPAYAGNIKALADKINRDFYTFMYDTMRDGTVKGPMGVVLMNFVGDPNVPGSTLMPNMVISNNFSFPLQMGKPSEPTKPGTNMPESNAGGFTEEGEWLWK